MNEKEKQEYLEKYHQEKEKGVPFFPDILFKDALVALIIFIILVGLAYRIGAPLEARADPADSTYTPRPEWYFLFLFQMLKYFPGNLEVIGVVVLPTLVIFLLFLLPFLDRSAKRHFVNRPIVTGLTVFGLVGIVYLTVQSYREIPPPTATSSGDQTAALYAKNCAPCHGGSISVEKGVNLHEIIAQGKHEGMPAWSGDLTSDQIDALVGFILSPQGNKVFNENCSKCHQATELAAGNPVDLKKAIELGQDFSPHSGLDIPIWSETLSSADRTALIKFLIAPDGQRLFATNCSPCHGKSVSVPEDKEQLKTLISQGGMHLDMPAWKDKLNENQIDTLAQFVVNPGSVPDGTNMFRDLCASCHGSRIPLVQDVEQAKEIISSGGVHQTMPVWGNVLTTEQLDALVNYAFDTAQGTPLEIGQELFANNCSPCHGSFGEGGQNPTRPGDIIAPISSSEYLKTRDDFTLQSIITQGQPNFGMSPFGSSFGGPLTDEEISAIVTYIRSWEANPPVELPPEIKTAAVSLSASAIYQNLCQQCHGQNGEGGIGSSLSAPTFQDQFTDQEIFDIINLGHKTTAMIGWGDVLTSDQIQQLVILIRGFRKDVQAEPGTPKNVSFSNDILPILEKNCKVCHGNMGGWDSSTYQTVMNTGNNAPVVIPGNAEGSLLAQKLLGTQSAGTFMPPSGKLPDSMIQPILDWINAGALNN
jgi:mono/diheme cytochrome c family protein